MAKPKFGVANLRISYCGGGMDRPEHFKDREMLILSEGLPVHVVCTRINGKTIYRNDLSHIKGLGSSAAYKLALLRANSSVRKKKEYTQRWKWDGYMPEKLPPQREDTIFKSSHDKERIMRAIKIESTNGGGFQDPIACAHTGLWMIKLYYNDFEVEELEKPPLFDQYRQLYRIPYNHRVKILSEQQQDPNDRIKLGAITQIAKEAVINGDYETLGKSVTAHWDIKKKWHKDIMNDTIYDMEGTAIKSGAYGYKVCGAGGQGAFLVIAEDHVHGLLREYHGWEQIYIGKR